MPPASISDVLSGAVRAANEAGLTYEVASSFDKWQTTSGAVFYALNQTTEMIQLIAGLRDHQDICVLDRAWACGADGSGHAVGLEIIALKLVHEAIVSRDVSGAVDQLVSAVRNRRVRATYVAALSGIGVTAPMSLTEHFDLVPFESLPASNSKSLLGNDRRFATGSIRNAPGAAIVSTFDYEPWFIDADTAAAGRGPGASSRYSPLESAVGDIVRCLTLFGPSSPRLAGQWINYGQTFAPMSGTQFTFDGLQPWLMRDIDLTGFNVRSVIEAFLSSSIRADLVVPLDRLNESLRARSQVNRAIDLGVCLEAALMRDAGDDNTAIGYRLALRGAFLFGEGDKERWEAFGLLRTIYNLRSRAVHSGRLEEQEKVHGSGIRRNARDILDDGTKLAARIIRKVIADGRWPSHWDRELIFNIGEDPTRS